MVFGWTGLRVPSKIRAARNRNVSVRESIKFDICSYWNINISSTVKFGTGII